MNACNGNETRNVIAAMWLQLCWLSFALSSLPRVLSGELDNRQSEILYGMRRIAATSLKLLSGGPKEELRWHLINNDVSTAAHTGSLRKHAAQGSRHIFISRRPSPNAFENVNWLFEPLNCDTLSLDRSAETLIGRNSRETLIRTEVGSANSHQIRNSATMRSIEAKLSFIMLQMNVYDLSGRWNRPCFHAESDVGLKCDPSVSRNRWFVLEWEFCYDCL